MRRVRLGVLLALVICALLATGCTALNDGTRPSSAGPGPDASREESVTPVSRVLLGERLPTTVEALESRYGRPATITRPSPDDPSPWGQWLEWRQKDHTTIRALVDDYDTATTDSKAGVRYIELRAPQDPAEYPQDAELYGFMLGRSTMDEVFDGLKRARPSMLHGRTELNPDGYYRATLKYERGGTYTYFFFGDSGVLVGEAQALFDLDAAD